MEEGEQVFHRRGTQMSNKLQGFGPPGNNFVGHEGQEQNVFFGKQVQGREHKLVIWCY